MSSSLKQQITSAFQTVGCELPSSTILSQIAALSTSLRLSPTQLAEAWEAHSLTKNIDVLNDNTFKGYHATLTKDKNVTVMSNVTGLGKRNMPGSHVTPSPAPKRATTDNTTPGSGTTDVKNEGSTTTRNGLSAVDNLTTPSGKGAPSPAASKQQPPGSAASNSSMVITPTKTSSVKYAGRTNSGQIVTSYNPHNLPSTIEYLATKKSTNEKQIISNHRGVQIKLHPLANHPTTQYRHMFTPLEKRSAALETRLNSMNSIMCQKYNIKSEEDEMIEAMDGIVKTENNTNVVSGEGNGKEEEVSSLWTPVGLPKQSKVICVGRICNEVRFNYLCVIFFCIIAMTLCCVNVNMNGACELLCAGFH